MTPPSNKPLRGHRFKVTDPDGYTVVLENACWYGHVLREHPDMGHRQMDTKSTIEHPDRVDSYLDCDPPNRVYFKEWEGRDPYGNKYLKVPTEVINPDKKLSRVLTAHPIAFMPPSPKRFKK